MFEQTFKNIDDILHKDAGCGSELDYVEQTSWVLFLKYLDDLEKDKKTAAELTGKTYTDIIAPEYQWSVWATPKDKDGKLDHHKALSGDDLKDFVDHKLFPYLKKFKADAESADTIEYKIGEIFSELKNRIQSGYNLREVINRIDELRFRTHAEKHEMSHLYEDKIKNMGNAGRNGGEYYTPRALIKTIVKVVAPKIGDKIYDGAVGSAGFLVEAFEYLKHSKNLTTADTEILQKKTFYGKEKKSLAYIIGTMNMILHGVEAPNIIHTNTLAENLADIQDKDRYDVILANPPFGGKERAEVQQNFPIKTAETASLFLQHFIKIMKAGGKAGIVIKNTFLSNTDNASIALRKKLLEECNLYSVLDLPGGTFTGAGVKTVVLFFEKGAQTRNVWFYQLNLDRNLGKTNALNEKDLAEFVELQKTFANSQNSWTVNVSDLDQKTFDLSAKNPSIKEEAVLRQPQEILKEIKVLDDESADILDKISKNYLQSTISAKCDGWEVKNFEDCIEKVIYTNKIQRKDFLESGELPIISQEQDYINGYWNNADDLFEVKRPIVIFGDHTQVLKYVDFDFVLGADGVKILQSKKEIEPKYFYYYLQNINLGSLGYARHYKLLKEIKIYFPRFLHEQQRIVDKLDTISTKTKRLEVIHQQKIECLAELKKSILQKAFNGEL